MAKKIVEHKYYIKIYKGVNEVDLQKFDEMIDTVQRATCMQINEKQKEAFKQKYDFEPEFEYGRDEKGHYVIRTSKRC